MARRGGDDAPARRPPSARRTRQRAPRDCAAPATRRVGRGPGARRRGAGEALGGDGLPRKRLRGRWRSSRRGRRRPRRPAAGSRTATRATPRRAGRRRQRGGVERHEGSWRPRAWDARRSGGRRRGRAGLALSDEALDAGSRRGAPTRPGSGNAARTSGGGSRRARCARRACARGSGRGPLDLVATNYGAIMARPCIGPERRLPTAANSRPSSGAARSRAYSLHPRVVRGVPAEARSGEIQSGEDDVMELATLAEHGRRRRKTGRPKP